MENVIEKYKVEIGEENVTPIVVLTGTLEEYEQFCNLTNRNTATAIAVRQGFQLEFYPQYEIVEYGNYTVNAAWDSQEYRARQGDIIAKRMEDF